jgi:error-prone DNA polymerase
VGERDDQPFPLPHGRGDQAYHGSTPDSREQDSRERHYPGVRDPKGVPNGIKVPTRDFR